MSQDLILGDVDALAARVPHGAKIAMAYRDGATPYALVHALIRAQVRGLHLVCIPTGSMGADLLIGAGCVETVETSGISLGEFGQSPAFGRAVRDGSVRVMDATCPAVYAALQAGAKRIPFIPLRGLIGSDVHRYRDDWKVIDNPFAEAGESDPIALLPAIVPDYSLIHVSQADRQGNLYFGLNRDLLTMAHAAKATLATVEEIQSGDLIADPLRRPATIPSVYVEALAQAENAELSSEAELARYAAMARTEDGFARYLEEVVYARRPAAA